MSVRVLIADDDAVIRRTLSSSLARIGFDVCTAPTGDQALRLAEVAPPDIALVDLHMPMGGLEIVRRLKAGRGPHIFVAILSGSDDAPTHDSCLNAGADAVFVKPISLLELRRQLESAAIALKQAATAS